MCPICPHCSSWPQGDTLEPARACSIICSGRLETVIAEGLRKPLLAADVLAGGFCPTAPAREQIGGGREVDRVRRAAFLDPAAHNIFVAEVGVGRGAHDSGRVEPLARPRETSV